MNKEYLDTLKGRKLPKITRLMSNDTEVSIKLSVKNNNDYSAQKYIK